MFDPKDVSEQELQTLKGDAVGDNLCSNKWIINTLMSLCEVREDDLTRELEDRLCMLWDLSMDKDVTSHLVSYNFLDIAKNILQTYHHSRLIEIILGIVANVCCNDNKIVDVISSDKELVTLILNRLISDDTKVLIQILRILESVFYKIEESATSDWIAHLIEFKSLGDIITFILKNSTNNELLTIAIKLLTTICEISTERRNFLQQLFKADDVILALLESFMQLISVEKDSYSTIELTFIKHWLRVLNVIITLDTFKFEDYKNDANIPKIMDIIYSILKPYEHSYNLFPIRQLEVDVIQECSYILLNFHCGWEQFPSKLHHLLLTIMFSIKIATQDYMHSNKKEFDPEEIFNKLLDDLSQYWIQSIRLSTDNQIVHVLRLCMPELRRYLINIVQSDPTIAFEISEKMERAVIACEKP